NLYFQGDAVNVNERAATKDELKSLHKLIKKVTWDIENFSFNTSVSAFMICVNELTSLKCNSREVLQTLAVLIAPFAPHIAEELWHIVGNTTSVCDAQWPAFNEDYLKEDSVTYAVSFNGKARFNMEVASGTSREDVEKMALEHESSARWMEGKTPKKVIVVPNKIVNIVI
ncbi:MAG: class I tRNA ligase family protein, partial [Muribaculaceae bacterium]|nr:class I tRNA ligase family protein [Muribaculaceae bacterium]